MSRKTYDTDIITLRRIFATNKRTNAPIQTNVILAGVGSGEVHFLHPLDVPSISTIGPSTLEACVPLISTGSGQSLSTIINQYLPSSVSTSFANYAGVTQLIAGANILINPTNGIGAVTITAITGGGSISQLNLVSTVAGLGTAGYLSTSGNGIIPDGLVSTANLRGLVSTSYLASQLASTVIGLGTAGYVSTALATSLPGGLVSTANLGGLISTSYLATQLASTVIGLGTAGYVSTAVANVPGGLVSTANLGGLISTSYLATQLTSTVIGLGTAGYLSSGSTTLPGGLVSTANLASHVSTTYLATQLTSTVIGLGTAGYVSTLQTSSKFFSISTGNVFVSTVNLLDTYTGVSNQLSVSSGTLLLNNSFITGSGGSAVTQIIAGTNITVSGSGTGVVTIGGATLQNIVSTANLTGLVSTTYLTTQLGSTVIGLGTAGYLSSIPLIGGFVSTANLVNFVSTANLTNHISTANLVNFVSTANLTNLISTANLGNLVSSSYLATQVGSTVQGLGTAGFLSTGFSTTIGTNFTTSNANIQSFTTSSIFFGTGTGFLTLPNTVVPNLSVGILYVSTLVGYTPGGGGSGISTVVNVLRISTGNIFTSTVNLLDTYTGVSNQLSVSSGTLLLNNSFITGSGGAAVTQIIAGTNITVSGSGTGIVTVGGASLQNIVSTANLIGLVSTNYLATQFGSTVIGLGTAGYLSSIPALGGFVSTANLASFVSTANLASLVSTANLTNLVSTTYLATQVASTVVGLGTAGYLSTLQISAKFTSISTGTVFTSSVNFLDTYTGNTNQLSVSSGTLLLNNSFITGSGGTAVSQIIAGANITVSGSGTGVVTVSGVSLQNLISTANLTSLISTANLANVVSTANLTGLISTANLKSLISTANLTSLVSTANLANVVSTANLTGLISTANLTSLISTANLASLISTANLINLVSTTNLSGLVSTTFFDARLTSSLLGLGTIGFLSTGYSTLIASSFSSSNANIQFFTTSTIVFGTGTGYLTLPNSVIPNLSVGVLYVSTLVGYIQATGNIIASARIGVNCNTPSYALDINGSAYINNDLNINGIVNAITQINLGGLQFAVPGSAGFNIAPTGEYVGINVTNPTYALDVSGDINVSGTGYYVNGGLVASDRRIKTDITYANLELCYSTLRDTPLHHFGFVSSFAQAKQDKHQLGFIADELSTIFPKSVFLNKTSMDGFSTIYYVNFEQIQLAHFGATKYMASLLDQQNSTIFGQNAFIDQQISTNQGQAIQFLNLQSQMENFSTILQNLLR